MPRKLIILSGVLVVVLGIAGYLFVFGKPGESQSNPFQHSRSANIDRIEIQNAWGKIELEKTPKGWELTSPARDAAEPEPVAQIVSAMEKFNLGSVVSENPSKYAQFQLDNAAATRLRVFLKAETAPTLDGYIGKAADSFMNSYFRLASSTRVVIAQDLPEYLFNRDAESFRLTRALPFSLADVTSFQARQDNATVDFALAGGSWTSRPGGKTWDAALVTPFLTKLQNLRVSQFGSGVELDAVTGLSQPPIEFTVHTASATLSLAIGKKTPATGTGALELRYAKAKDRDAVLRLREDNVTDLLSSLKTLR